MKNKLTALTSLILILTILMSVFSACDSIEEITTDVSLPAESEETGTESANNSEDSTEVVSAVETESATESESATENETETSVSLSGEHALIIENADKLANGVNAYFPNADRHSFVIENQNVSLDYALKHYDDQLVNSIKSVSGKAYVENTMDVFVRMKNGNTYYASKSSVPTATNLYRMGYYLYELRLESQVFAMDISAADSYQISLEQTTANGIKRRINQDGDLYALISNSTDPYIAFSNVNYPTEKYNYLQITMKANLAENRSIDVYLAAGEQTNFNSKQIKTFHINPSDEYYTYNIPLDSITDYTGNVTKFRLDINVKVGEEIFIKDIKVIDAGDTAAPKLALNRSFFIFSDKLHQRLQIVAQEKTNDIEEIGMITKIPTSTVEKLIVKDSKGEYSSIENVDWSSVEYIGFDVKDTGIFGYILPKDATSGTLTVSLEDNHYVLVQSRTPENNTIIPSVLGTQNANDFYMGQRIYTDESHSFDEFLYEAYCERNPLPATYFRINEEKSDNGSYDGYDPLRGVYVISVAGGGFNTSYYTYPNKHYNVNFTVVGDKTDRNLYILNYTDSGNLECAVLLDRDGMMLPIPLEVGKNFKGDGEDNIFNLDDKGFSDTVFPLALPAGERATYTIVNLYQNWGRFPLKQISWIQFHAPYYHLSTGVTETNCIVPWYTTKGARSITAVLPDHRAMSAPFWENQPQHTAGGSHSFLQYTDINGNYSATENTRNTIDSYGPTYADIVMDYISDDGKIFASYTHMEMPQTDENRGYYEMKYEVLEDLTIENFRTDFSFYAVSNNIANSGAYTQFGYLNQNNECTVAAANLGDEPITYVLGDNCPYFDYCNKPQYSGSQLGYVNLSFLVYNYEFIIGGEKQDVNFAVTDHKNRASISLDLGKVELKAGDTFTINAIIMPWGSHETIYDSDETAPDQNVRDVRANTLLDPLTVKAEANCEILESPYLPKLKTLDGKSAEFTLSGGENNSAVRIYGFDLLTAPKIYEKIDGEWQEYVVNSSKTPDSFGIYHYYDGYAVYYDGDGTYSYSFVVDMSGTVERTFRITASDEFTPWPEEVQIELPDPLDVYLDPNELHVSAVKAPGVMFGKIETATDGGVNYISFYGNDGETPESYLTVYSGGEKVTGQYFVMKYRLPKANSKEIKSFEIYTSTVNPKVAGTDGYSIQRAIIPDGEWHVLVVDMSVRGKATFVPAEDGTYSVKYLRIDIFNSKTPSDTRYDIAYIGFCDTMEEIFALNPDLNSVMMSVGEADCYYVDRNGEQIAEEVYVDTTSLNFFLDAARIESQIGSKGTRIGTRELVEADGVQSYLKVNSYDGGASEGYFFALMNASPASVGQYLTIKYRTSQTSNFELFSGTSAVYTMGDNKGQPKKNVVSPEGNDVIQITQKLGFVADGEWNVLVVDLAAALPNYKSTDNGYAPYFLRLDLFGKTTDQISVDLAYIGIGDDLTKVITAEKILETVTYSDGKTVKHLSTATGEEVISE